MQVRVFPSDDDELEQAVAQAITELRIHSLSHGTRRADDADANPTLLDAVTERLRRVYPDLMIGTQSDLGRLGDEPRRWYVYRDGKAARDPSP